MSNRIAVTAAVTVALASGTGTVRARRHAHRFPRPGRNRGRGRLDRPVSTPTAAPAAPDPAFDPQAVALVAFADRMAPNATTTAGAPVTASGGRDATAATPSSHVPVSGTSGGDDESAPPAPVRRRHHRPRRRRPPRRSTVRQRRRLERGREARARGVLPRRGRRLMGRRTRPAAASRLLATGLSTSATLRDRRGARVRRAGELRRRRPRGRWRSLRGPSGATTPTSGRGRRPPRRPAHPRRVRPRPRGAAERARCRDHASRPVPATPTPLPGSARAARAAHRDPPPRRPRAERAAPRRRRPRHPPRSRRRRRPPNRRRRHLRPPVGADRAPRSEDLVVRDAGDGLRRMGAARRVGAVGALHHEQDARTQHRAPAWVLDLHRHLGGLAVAFVAVHLAVLPLDTFTHWGWPDLFVPMASSWHPIPIAFGIVAFYLLLAVEISSLLGRRVPARWWRRIHFLSFPLYIIASVHLFTAGTDAGNVVARWTVVVVSTLIAFLTVVRVLAAAKPAGDVEPRSPPRLGRPGRPARRRRTAARDRRRRPRVALPPTRRSPAHGRAGRTGRGPEPVARGAAPLTLDRPPAAAPPTDRSTSAPPPSASRSASRGRERYVCRRRPRRLESASGGRQTAPEVRRPRPTPAATRRRRRRSPSP